MLWVKRCPVTVVGVGIGGVGGGDDGVGVGVDGVGVRGSVGQIVLACLLYTSPSPRD